MGPIGQLSQAAMASPLYDRRNKFFLLFPTCIRNILAEHVEIK